MKKLKAYLSKMFRSTNISKNSLFLLRILGQSHLCSLFQLNNPDMRVVLLKDFVKKHFPATPVMDYAIEVEKITTSKVTLTPV